MVVEPTEALVRSGVSTRRTSWRRRGLLAGVLVAILGVGLLWWSGRSAGSGDPGGKVMDQLVPAASALPGYGTGQLPWEASPTLNGPYLTKMEPHQDSCDGRAGTQGWSQVVVQAGFAWGGSPTELFSRIDRRLQTLGWSDEPVGQTIGSQFVWSKRLTNGSAAQLSLDSRMSGSSEWESVAVAPPVGRTASGC